jgi:hypothetical protein
MKTALYILLAYFLYQYFKAKQTAAAYAGAIAQANDPAYQAVLDGFTGGGDTSQMGFGAFDPYIFPLSDYNPPAVDGVPPARQVQSQLRYPLVMNF